MYKHLFTTCAAALSLFAAAPAAAAVTFTFSQVGNNVVLTGTGSLNLTGATALGGVLASGFVNSGGGSLAVGGASPNNAGDAYQLTSTAGAFGTGGFTPGNLVGGPLLGLDASSFVYVARGYVSGTAIAGSAQLNNRTFASLGLTAGTYTYRIPNDTITVIVPGAIPEPATWAMMIGGFGLVGSAMRRQAVRLHTA